MRKQRQQQQQQQQHQKSRIKPDFGMISTFFLRGQRVFSPWKTTSIVKQTNKQTNKQKLSLCPLFFRSERLLRGDHSDVGHCGQRVWILGHQTQYLPAQRHEPQVVPSLLYLSLCSPRYAITCSSYYNNTHHHNVFRHKDKDDDSCYHCHHQQ